jgi:hypothetical protein
MWCVNPHLTNKILVCVNSTLGHFNVRIVLPKESLKPIIFMDIWDTLNQISTGLLKSNIRVMCL